MAGMEERYKKYIEKAKSVIKTLDPKHNPNAAPEINILRAQLSEKEKVIDELERESEKSKVSIFCARLYFKYLLFILLLKRL